MGKWTRILWRHLLGFLIAIAVGIAVLVAGMFIANLIGPGAVPKGLPEIVVLVVAIMAGFNGYRLFVRRQSMKDASA